MAKAKVKLNSQGCAEILNYPELARLVDECGQRIKFSCDSRMDVDPKMVNPNFVVKDDTAVINGTKRPVSVVIAANPHSIAHNAKHNTMLKGIQEAKL